MKASWANKTPVEESGPPPAPRKSSGTKGLGWMQAWMKVMKLRPGQWMRHKAASRHAADQQRHRLTNFGFEAAMRSVGADVYVYARWPTEETSAPSESS